MGNNTRLLILALGSCTLSQAAHAGRLIREERGKSQTQGNKRQAGDVASDWQGKSTNSISGLGRMGESHGEIAVRGSGIRMVRERRCEDFRPGTWDKTGQETSLGEWGRREIGSGR